MHVKGEPMAERRFDLIVFDWDGTLMDSAASIVGAIQAAARALGVAEPDDERARHVIGLGLIQALAHAMPDLPPDRYDEAVQHYRHHYLSQDHELVLFSGMTDLLDELSRTGHLLAVATGKSRLGLNRALQHGEVGHFFDATRCADECHSKPHPQMLHELMDELMVAPARVLMVGDTTHDLQMAANAGVASLAVSYGAHPEAALTAAGPLGVMRSPCELVSWLLEGG